MLSSGLLTSKLLRVVNCVQFCLNLGCMKVVYLTTKTIQIEPYTICSSHQLGLEVERPERSTTFSFFHYITP